MNFTSPEPNTQHVTSKKKIVNDFLKNFIIKNCFNFTYPKVRHRIAFHCK
jgi:hypothetical protein